jgi:hypothetical protein
MQCKVSYDNKILGVLLHSGNFISFNLNTLSNATSERNLIPATAKDSKQKPQLELTQRFAYITLPATGELQFFSFKDIANSKKIKVSNTPYRLTIMGFENSGDH